MPESNEAIVRRFFDFCIKLNNFTKSNHFLKQYKFLVKITNGKSSSNTDYFLPISRFIDYNQMFNFAKSAVFYDIGAFISGQSSTVFLQRTHDEYDEDDGVEYNENTISEYQLELTSVEIEGIIKACSSLMHTVTFKNNAPLCLYSIDISLLSKSNVALSAESVEYSDCNICKCHNIISYNDDTRRDMRTFCNCTFEKGWSSYFNTTRCTFVYDSDAKAPVDFSFFLELAGKDYSVDFDGKPKVPVLWSTLPYNSLGMISIRFRGNNQGLAGMINDLIAALTKRSINLGITINDPIDGPINLVTLLAHDYTLYLKNKKSSPLQKAVDLFAEYYVMGATTESVLEFQDKLFETGLSQYAR